MQNEKVPVSSGFVAPGHGLFEDSAELKHVRGWQAVVFFACLSDDRVGSQIRVPYPALPGSECGLYRTALERFQRN
jgi:hypothetical protein